MKKWLKRAAYVFTTILVVAAIIAAITWFTPSPTYTPQTIDVHAVPTPERLARGREIASVLCTQCHLDPQTGKLSGRSLPKSPLGDSTAPNITTDPEHGIGSWTDGQIVYALRTGVTPSGRFAGVGMPRLNLMSEEDMIALVTFLRSNDPLVAASNATHPPQKRTFLGKALLRFAIKPPPYPTSPVPGPNAPDAIDEGRYLVQGVALCWRCHSASYASHDVVHPERSKGYLGGGTDVLEATGQTIFSPNITSDPETGLGKWTEEQFIVALRKGLRPDGTALSPAMPMFDELSDTEARAIWAYLRSVPPIQHLVPRPVRSAEPAASPGRRAYVKYGCIGCHGETGVLVGDLRKANTDFPGDDDLKAWIQHPSAKRPGTKMPDYDGVIAPDDYSPLMAYVRSVAAPR